MPRRAFVLNVNADDASRSLVTHTLEQADYAVVEAPNGLEALLLARHRPEVMVMDVALPDISGLEVCRRLKSDADLRAIPVLQISATFVSAERKVEGLDSGADACLALPIDPAELVATVRSLLRPRQMERERQAADRQRAEQLAELDRRKDEFLGMLAHELRNPLNAIAAANSLMDRVGAQDARNERLRNTVRRQTRHLARLVDDLLEVSRVTRGKMRLQPEPADLVVIVKAAVESARPLIESRNQLLDVTTPSEPMPLMGDALRLEQVFVNLLQNASKYSEPGSRIAVECVCVSEPAPRGCVRVTDEGVGIPADKLDAIFDFFVQVDQSLARSLGGLGLGLTIARRLVELHGGTIRASSAGAGLGSQFSVEVPLTVCAVDGEPQLHHESEAADDPSLHPLTILVIEDNHDARETMHAWLEELGHRVYTAADGAEGLDVARTIRPHVALVDIGLPGIDGYQVARTLRETDECRQAFLVAITGYGRPEDSARAREAGFDIHLVKPIQPERLAGVIRIAATHGVSGGAASNPIV